MTDFALTPIEAAPAFNPEAAVRHALMVVDGRVKTTSRHVAEVFGKRHDDVLKAIRNLECSETFGLRNFAETSYIDAFNREQKLYEMTFNGFVRLVGCSNACVSMIKSGLWKWGTPDAAPVAAQAEMPL